MESTPKKRGRPSKAAEEVKHNNINSQSQSKKVKVEDVTTPDNKTQEAPIKDAVQLLNEIVPDDRSLTIKLEFDETPDSPTSPANLSKDQKTDEANSKNIGQVDTDDTDSNKEGANDFEETPYISRADMVLKMDNISKTEKEACYELFEPELIEAIEKYVIKYPHDDPESMCDFFFFPLLDPPIDPELKKVKFAEPIGPIKEFTAYEAFLAIWNKSVMEDIVRATNKNGNQFSKKDKWTDTNVDELYVFFAITLATSDCAHLERYWLDSTNRTHFPHVMTYKRFVVLNKFLSFTDWNMDLYSQPQAKLFHIKPIIDHLNKSFSTLFRIGRDIVVDEPTFMCKSDGGYKFLKNKCKMQEIDVSDAKTGYVWKFDVITQDYKVIRGIPPYLILKLVDELQFKGYTIWTNNAVHRLLLARILKHIGFNSVGTLRIKDIIATEYALPKGNGEIIGCTSGDLDFIAWRHKKVVSLVSSYHGKTTTKDNGKITPTAFVDYRNAVESLDKRDLILADYNLGADCTKWIQKMFRRLLNISVFNSLILHKYNTEFSADSYKKHRFTLISELVKRHKEINTVLPSIVKQEIPIKRAILPDSYWEHFPEEFGVVTGKTRQKIQKSCHLCHKKTNTRCPACDVALCLSTCHRVYHSMLSRISE